ncbi:ABC transporter permease [Kallotenue papyrolyticum]|uniref:ABC transporter permease n=1 Tax=Kallotenue papyrolyticum TaxID=1325125 RepID=UPI00137828EC|nr:ABC-2 family transporter protein [Kallotenue papyrolyticum]
MQYKTSFALELIGFGLVTGLEFVALALLLRRFGPIAGWTLPEVALLYGLASIALGLAEMIGRGFDVPFEQMLARGTFDTVLARPLGSFFQVLAAEFQLRRLGRMLQGVAALLYGLSQLALLWTPSKLVLLPLTIAAGTTIYLALMVIGATVCFWTIKTPEVINVFTNGGAELTSYPLSIYHRGLRTVFLVIVPVAFANYPAALWLLGRRDPFGLPAWLAWVAPLVALAFLGVAWAFWTFGVSKYQGAGS